MVRSNGRNNGTRWTRIRRSLVVSLASGTMLATSCNSNSVRALIDGIDAATSSLDRNLSGQNQTFGEWLLGELLQ